MDFLIFNNPFTLPWQTVVMEAVVYVMFGIALTYTIRKWMSGRRIYGVLMMTAGMYGLILECVGTMMLRVYQRGTFALMVDPTAIPFLHDVPALPLYMVAYYPTVIFVGYKTLEAMGVRRPAHCAAIGGLFTVAMEAPYVIQGHLDQLSWWTYNQESPLVQYVGTWPMIDLCWLATCHALLFAVIARVRRDVDPRTVLGHTRWSNTFALLGFPIMTVLSVLALTSVMLSPLGSLTLIGLPQWPVAAGIIAAFGVVSVNALRVTHTTGRCEWVTVAMVGLYVITFVAMIIDSALDMHTIDARILTQIVGVLVVILFTAYPALSRKRRFPVSEFRRQAITTPGI